MNTRVHAGFRLGAGGTSALTPTLSRSGEGEPSTASVRCGNLGLSCGGHGERGLGGAAARTLEDKGDVRGQLRVCGNEDRNPHGMMAGGFNFGGATRVEKPGSGCDFVLEDVGRELVMRRECPEFGADGGGRKGGVKAVEGYRSPCPGGLGSTLGLRSGYVTEGGPHSPRQRRDWHFEGFRRGSAEGEDESASIWRTLKSPCGFVFQSTDGECVTSRNCPEIGGGGGVKAVPMQRDRSPSPGGRGSTLGLRGGSDTEGGPHPPRHRRDWHLEGFRRESEGIWWIAFDRNRGLKHCLEHRNGTDHTMANSSRARPRPSSLT